MSEHKKIHEFFRSVTNQLMLKSRSH